MTKRRVTDAETGIVSRVVAWCPADLIVILVFLALANLAIVILETALVPLRVLFGAPMLLFLPGYVLVTALFPRRSPAETPDSTRSRRFALEQYCSLKGTERAALSFGLSVAVLPLFSLVFSLVGASFTADAVVPTISLIVLFGSVASASRRSTVESGVRFDVPFENWSRQTRQLLSTSGLRNKAVNVALVLSVAFALTAAGYALAAPQDGERYSEMSLLTETEDGEYVAGNYPEELGVGEERELVVSVENQEQAETEYTIVTRVERVDAGGDTTSVIESQELRRSELTLAPGEKRYDEHAVSTDMVGIDLRLSYYLYEGDAPEDVNGTTADRHVYIWIDATDGS